MLFIPLLPLVALSIGLFAAWLSAELRGKSPRIRIALGIAMAVSVSALIWTSWQIDARGKMLYDHMNFGQAPGFLELAIQQNKSHEVGRILAEFNPTNPENWNYEAVSRLRSKLGILTEKGSSPHETPTPKSP